MCATVHGKLMLLVLSLFGCRSDFNLKSFSAEIVLEDLGLNGDSVSFENYCGVFLNPSEEKLDNPNTFLGNIFYRNKECREDSSLTDCFWQDAVSILNVTNLAEGGDNSLDYRAYIQNDGTLESKYLLSILGVDLELGGYLGIEAYNSYWGSAEANLANIGDAEDTINDLQSSFEVSYISSLDLKMLSVTLFREETGTTPEETVTIDGTLQEPYSQEQVRVVYPCMQPIR